MRAEMQFVAIVAVAACRQQKGNHFGLAAGCNLAMAGVPRSASPCGLARQDIRASRFVAVFRIAGMVCGKVLQAQDLVQDLVDAVVVALRAV